jgi:hypothetical protein
MGTDIEIRVRRLERANRILILVVLAAAFVLVTGATSQGDDDDTIRSQRFELVDVDGSVRAVFRTDADGSTGIFIRDPEGSLRLSLTHDPDQSALFIYDDEGTVRIGVAQFSHGGGGVALHGARSKGAAVLYHKETGSLSFYDKDGNTTTRVPRTDR